MSRSRIVNLANFESFQAINVLSDPGHIGGPVVIPQCVKVMLVWTLGDGKLARNVMGGIVNSFTTASATVAQAMYAALVGNSNTATYLAQIAPTAQLTRVEIQDMRQAQQPVYASTGAASPGTGTGTEMPNEVALCVTLRAQGIGASNRGRMYMPGWGTQALGAGNVANAPAVTALTNFINFALPAMFAAGGLSQGIMNPARQAYTGVTGTQHPARSASIKPLASISVRDNHWDSQRRRGLK